MARPTRSGLRRGGFGRVASPARCVAAPPLPV